MTGWKEFLSSWDHNLPMKLTAFAVAFVFWFLMLGRQDVTLSRDLEVQVGLPPQLELANQVPTTVTVEVVGPRVALKRFSSKKEVYKIDLSGLKEGYHQVTLEKAGINLPLGLELLGIRPKRVDVVIRRKQDDSDVGGTKGGSSQQDSQM